VKEFKILITPRPFFTKGGDIIRRLKEKGYSVVINDTGKRLTSELLEYQLQDVDAVLTGNDHLSAELLTKAPRLKVISKYGVGLDNIDLNFCNSHGILVKKAIGANAISVAEMAILLMMIGARRIIQLTWSVETGESKRIVGQELFGKTLGIIGYGSIGKIVSKYAQGLGMNVLVNDPYIKSYNPNENTIKLVRREDIFKMSDVISLHMPLTHGTRGLIDQKSFKLLKPDAVLINTARAEIVNEKDLYDWLNSNEQAFAAEDVELNKRHEKIRQLNNYLITPHAASFTEEADRKTMIISVKNITDYFDNEGKDKT
jgi:glycerate dehydrogenase/D-3-phosphoglycerate dehydrogenase